MEMAPAAAETEKSTAGGTGFLRAGTDPVGGHHPAPPPGEEKREERPRDRTAGGLIRQILADIAILLAILLGIVAVPVLGMLLGCQV